MYVSSSARLTAMACYKSWWRCASVGTSHSCMCGKFRMMLLWRLCSVNMQCFYNNTHISNS